MWQVRLYLEFFQIRKDILKARNEFHAKLAKKKSRKVRKERK